MKAALAILLAIATLATLATAQDKYCLTDGATIGEPKAIPSHHDGVNAYNHRPASVWHEDGWRLYRGVQAAPVDMTAISPKTLTLIADEVWTVPTYTNTVAYEAEQAAALAAAAAQAIVDADAAHEATAPGADLSSWSKREKCLLLITFKLVKEHWPSMTQQQFLDNVKTEWDSVK